MCRPPNEAEQKLLQQEFPESFDRIVRGTASKQIGLRLVREMNAAELLRWPEGRDRYPIPLFYLTRTSDE